MTNATDPVRAILAQLRHEVEQDKGGYYTNYERGRLEEKRRSIQLLEAALAQQPAAPLLDAVKVPQPRPDYPNGVLTIEAARDAFPRSHPMFAALDQAASDLAVLDARDRRRKQPAPPSAPVGVDGLAGLLEQIRDLLASLPVDCLGTDTTAGGQPYPIRDEVIHGITKALAQQPEACDMGALCIGCEPRNADGTCPGQQPEAPAQEAVAGEPVAVVGADFTLFWAGSGPIAPLVRRHGIKVGSQLYAAPQPAIPEGTWRLLKKGEAIQRGDEVLADNCVEWGPLCGWERGMAYDPAAFVPVRRRIKEPGHG